MLVSSDSTLKFSIESLWSEIGKLFSKLRVFYSLWVIGAKIRTNVLAKL